MATQLQASVAYSAVSLPHTTPIPDQLFDDLLPLLSGAELKAYLYIARRTFGFRKDRDQISLSQMLQGITTRAGRILDRGTGLTKKTLLKALRSLEKKGLIHTERQYSAEQGHEPTLYRINILPLDHRETNPPPLEEPVPQGLEEKLPQGLGEEIPPGTWSKNSPPQQTWEQETALQETEKQDTDNNTAPEDAGVVVASMTKLGLSEKAASKLVQSYPEDYILDKVDQVQWLLETGAAQAPQNPAGYLRRAIEEDYIPPPRYENRRAKQEQLAREEEVRQQREVETREAARRLRQQAQQGIEADTHLEEAWSQALARLRGQLPGLTCKMYLEKTRPLGMEGNVAIIETTDQFGVEQLELRYGFIVRALEQVLGREVEVEFVAAVAEEELAADD